MLQRGRHSAYFVGRLVGLVVISGEAIVRVMEVFPCFRVNICEDFMRCVYYVLQYDFEGQVQACGREESDHKVSITMERYTHNMTQASFLHWSNKVVDIRGDPVVVVYGH